MTYIQVEFRSAPRGCRSGKQVKNKSYKIKTITTNVTNSNNAIPSHCRSSVASIKSTLTTIEPLTQFSQITDKRISLGIVNTQSICGPEGKTKVFVDYVLGAKIDICLITETFLTEENNVTRADLHPIGYKFSDQPRISGEARGGTGVFYQSRILLG